MLINKSHRLLLIILVAVLLISGAGCNNEEEKVYDIDTDEEFQQAAKANIERFFREENSDAIYNELYEEFSERYDEEEIYAYVSAMVEEEKELLRSQEDDLQQNINELEEQIDDYEEQLDQLANADTMQQMSEQTKPLVDWVDDLNEKINETHDLFRKIELMEELENTLKELSIMLEEKIDTLEDSDIEEPDEETSGDFFSYYEDIYRIVEKDRDITEAYESVSGDNFISKTVLHDELTENVIPDTEDLVSQLSRINPRTEEVEELHQRYKDGWDKQLQGFNLWVEAIKEENQNKVDEAVELVEKGEVLKEEFLEELDQLVEETINS